MPADEKNAPAQIAQAGSFNQQAVKRELDKGLKQQSLVDAGERNALDIGDDKLLKITIVEANLTRDTDFLSKMDPFVTFVYNQNIYNTQVLDEAGKNPKWDRTFELIVKNKDDEISFIVMD
jgi:hypothetical protein